MCLPRITVAAIKWEAGFHAPIPPIPLSENLQSALIREFWTYASLYVGQRENVSVRDKRRCALR